MDMAIKHLNREDWQLRALEILAAEGIQGVKVERVAQALGATKGSFYWHFKNREDLLKSMLDYWKTQLTGEIIKDTKALQVGPEERLAFLMRAIEDQNLNAFELAVRAWSAFDPLAKGVVREVDELRLGYLNGLFREMGFRGADCELRARLFMNYEVAGPSILADPGENRRRRLAKLLHRLLTTPKGEAVK